MKFFLTLLLLIGCSTVRAQHVCSDYKNGTYSTSFFSIGELLIVRKGKKQIERVDQTGEVLKYKVQWIDDCSYTLQLKKVVKGVPEREYNKDIVVLVRILKSLEDGYVQETSIQGNSSFEPVVSTMKRID